MEFNKNWTKEDNDKMREMFKEGKTHDDVINYFGEEKVKFHPKKKFHRGKHLPMFNNFISEIKINPKKTEYIFQKIDSISYKNKKDIVTFFNINNHEYVLVLFYMFENNIQSYEILFTTKKQYDEYFLLLPGKHFTEEEQDTLKKILENNTKFNELYDLLKSITFILVEMYDDLKFFFGDIIFSITETDNPIKIRLYKNIIKDSFPNFSYKRRKINSKYIYYYSKNKN